MLKIKKIFNLFNIFILILLIAFIGEFLLYNHKDLRTGFNLLFTAGILFSTFLYFFERKEDFSKIQINIKKEVIILFFIIIISVFFRLYKIKEIPPGCFFDDAQMGREALNIIRERIIEGTCLPVYLERNSQHNPAMYAYFIAVFFKIFGVDCWQIRLVSAFFGILTTFSLFFLFRNLYDKSLGLIGAFILATSYWHINFSRIGFRIVFAIFTLILSLYFLGRVYKYRKISDFIFFGLTTALTQYSYQPIRFYLIYLIIFGIYILFKDKSFYLQNWKKLLLAIFVGIIVFYPLGNYIIKNPDKYFMGRAGDTVIFNKKVIKNFFHKDLSVTDVLKFNIKRTLLMYNYEGDHNIRHNLPGKPMLGFIVGAFAFLGFIFTISKMLTFPYNLFLLNFIIFIVPGFITIEAPHSLRTMLVLPSIIFFASIAFYKTFLIIKYFINKDILKKYVFTTILIIFIILTIYESYDVYFIKKPKVNNYFDAYSMGEFFIGKYLLKNAKNKKIRVIAFDDSLLNNYTINFVTDEFKNINIKKEEFNKIRPIKNVIYIMKGKNEKYLKKLKNFYPKENIKIFSDNDGKILATIFEVK